MPSGDTLRQLAGDEGDNVRRFRQLINSGGPSSNDDFRFLWLVDKHHVALPGLTTEEIQILLPDYVEQ